MNKDVEWLNLPDECLLNIVNELDHIPFVRFYTLCRRTKELIDTSKFRKVREALLVPRLHYKDESFYMRDKKHIARLFDAPAVKSRLDWCMALKNDRIFKWLYPTEQFTPSQNHFDNSLLYGAVLNISDFNSPEYMFKCSLCFQIDARRFKPLRHMQAYDVVQRINKSHRCVCCPFAGSTACSTYQRVEHLQWLVFQMTEHEPDLDCLSQIHPELRPPLEKTNLLALRKHVARHGFIYNSSPREQ